jgi:hypothetical protein
MANTNLPEWNWQKIREVLEAYGAKSKYLDKIERQGQQAFYERQVKIRLPNEESVRAYLRCMATHLY